MGNALNVQTQVTAARLKTLETSQAAMMGLMGNLLTLLQSVPGFPSLPSGLSALASGPGGFTNMIANAPNITGFSDAILNKAIASVGQGISIPQPPAIPPPPGIPSASDFVNSVNTAAMGRIAGAQFPGALAPGIPDPVGGGGGGIIPGGGGGSPGGIGGSLVTGTNINLSPGLPPIFANGYANGGTIGGVGGA